MVSLREWRTAGIIQSTRVWAVLQEQWLKGGSSIAYTSDIPWLFQDGCDWQDMKDIYSQLSPELVDSRVIICYTSQSFFVPPLLTFPFALSCSAGGVWHRQKTLSTLRGKVTTKLGPEYENFMRSLGKQLRAWCCLHGITQWFPHFTNPLIHSFSHRTAGITRKMNFTLLKCLFR